MAKTNGVATELVVDRSRITYKESKQATIMGMIAQKAQAALDFETIERVYTELDKLIMKVTVSLPDGWLPSGVTLETDNWIDHLSQENAARLLAALQDANAEKKTV